MKNPLIKNCKTGIQDDILNRTSHYLKLLNTRSTIDNRRSKQYQSLHSLRSISGHRDAGMSMTSNNLKLMRSIIDIDQKYSRYAMDSIDQKRSYKRTLKNKWKQKQKQQELIDRNASLYKKITTIESDLSLDKLNEFDKQMSKYSKIMRNPIRHVTEMDQRFYNTYRQEAYKIKTSREKLKLEDINQQGSKIRKSKRKRLTKMRENANSHPQNQLILQQITSAT